MSRVIVIEFLSLDGVMHDPDGSDGSPQGGWAFRYGQEAVAGDKFGLGEVLDTGAMLLGRRTWELFAKIWPGRDDPFSAKMNAMPKLVVSRSLEHAHRLAELRRAPGRPDHRGAKAQAGPGHRDYRQRQRRPHAGGSRRGR